MRFLEEDLKILREFCNLNDKEISSWNLMKRIYPKGRDREHMRIRQRIKKMEKQGLFFVNGKKYILVSDFTKLNKIPKIKNFISVKTDGKWSIFEI